jgi:hypothetical protein
MKTTTAVAALAICSAMLLACGEGTIFQVKGSENTANPGDPNSPSNSDPAGNGGSRPIVPDGGSGFLPSDNGSAQDGGRPSQQDAAPRPPQQDAAPQPTQQDAAPTTECNPPCQTGEVCQSGQCVAQNTNTYEAERQRCFEAVNYYRGLDGKPALTARSKDLEACADEGAKEDATTGNFHGHYYRTGGCNGLADGSIEAPDWPLSSYGGTLLSMVQQTAKMAYDERPGEGTAHGHYNNMMGEHNVMGCGFYYTSSGTVWIVHYYR